MYKLASLRANRRQVTVATTLALAACPVWIMTWRRAVTVWWLLAAMTAVTAVHSMSARMPAAAAVVGVPQAVGQAALPATAV
jgi:hypothetical protein